MTAWRWLVLVATACGDNSSARLGDGGPTPTIDASQPFVCWPDGPYEPRGTIESGIGTTSFAPVPAMMPLLFGDQAGFYIDEQARITGLEPGDPANVLAPGNPRTHFTVFLADTMMLTTTAHCGYRRGYVPSPDQPGAYDLVVGLRLGFDTCYRPEDLFYKNMVMRVEIVDASNGYAVNEVQFEALPPVDWNPNDPPPTGSGCP